MKTKLLLPFLLVSFFNFAQLTVIPDPEFERYLISMGFDTTNSEGLQDGFVETERLGYISHLYFFNNEFQIRDFTGIEDFGNLQEFVVTNGQIVHTLDISQNSQLVAFAIDGCRLDLDFSQNINLQTLELYRSEQESLDLTHNQQLSWLNLQTTKIKELDLSQSPELSGLLLSGNVFLERIDITVSDILYSPQSNALQIENCPALTCIEVLDTAVAQSNVDTYKWYIYNDNYSFSLDCNFDKSHIPDDNFEQALIDLGYDDVLDDYVLLSNIDDVATLNLSNKNISDLTGIKGFSSLQNLNISENNLKELDLSTNKSLISLNASSNQLQTINVKNENNQNIVSFNALNNPDLFCIKSDNPSYSIFNWTQVDSNTSFGDNCIKAPLFFTHAPIMPIEIEIFANNFNVIETLPGGLILDINTGILSGAPTTEFLPSNYAVNYDKGNDTKTAIIHMEAQKLGDYSIKSFQLRGFYSTDNGQFNIDNFYVYSDGYNVSAFKNGSANSYQVGTSNWCDNGIYPLIDGGRYSSNRYNPVASEATPVIYTVEITQTDGYSIDDIRLDFGYLVDFELYFSEDNESWTRLTGGKKITTWTNNPEREYDRMEFEPFTFTSFSPHAGTAGTQVIITGNNFDLAQKVTFGGVEVEFTIDSKTQITAFVNENVQTGAIKVKVSSACDYLVLEREEDFINSQGIIWTEENQWSNGVGATDDSLDVLIIGDLETSGDFYAKNLIIAPGGSIKMTDGNMYIAQSIVNQNEDETAFILESGTNLIQASPTPQNIGNITIQRESQPMVRLDYTMWSSPVKGQQLQAFSPYTLPNRIYIYDSDWDGNIYYPVENAQSDFEIGEGYLFRSPNNWTSETPTPYVGSFIGKPFSGDLAVRIGTAAGYESIGNPYPSNIDPSDFMASNSEIQALYFWNNPRRVFNESTQSWEYIGTKYISYNELGYSDEAFEGNSISVGQGFIVYNVGSYRWAHFDNGMRTTDSEFFFRNGTERHRFWLNLTNEENLSYNKILVGYMTGATNEVDSQIDALHFGYEGSALYNLINEEKYTIQGRALPFENSDVVKLGFKAAESGKFNISLNNFDGLFAEGNTIIYLKDKELDVIHNLNESAYSFESIAGEFNERFEVVYGETGTMDIDDLNANKIQIYTQNENIFVSSKNEKILSVELYDLSGRNIHSNQKVNANLYQIKSNSKGVLVVKVQTQNGEILTKKIINR